MTQDPSKGGILPKLTPLPGISARKLKRMLDQIGKGAWAKTRMRGVIWPPRGPR